MIRTIQFLSVFLLVFCTASGAYGGLLIELKGGAEIVVDNYWEVEGEIRYSRYGGVIGIPIGEVKDIRPTDRPVAPEARSSRASGIVPSAASPVSGEASIKSKAAEGAAVEEELDMEAYIAKMNQLKAALNRTLRPIRVATENNDQDGLDKAREENRAISAEMHRLTDELKEKNRGELPPGWWEGIGREEPAGKE